TTKTRIQPQHEQRRAAPARAPGCSAGCGSPRWVRACTIQGRHVRRWVALRCAGGRTPEVSAAMPLEIPAAYGACAPCGWRWAEPLMVRNVVMANHRRSAALHPLPGQNQHCCDTSAGNSLDLRTMTSLRFDTE